jgi:hypothetical protein
MINGIAPINNVQQMFDTFLRSPLERLTILENPTTLAASPQGMMGSALPPDSFIPKRCYGVYGEDGKLRSITAPGCSFLKYA